MVRSIVPFGRKPPTLSDIVLVTGGARSGKSRYAQSLAERIGGSRVFIATCPPFDEEMRRRIQRHQAERRKGGWRTVEAPVDLEKALDETADFDVRLVDCLTLWINNLMHEAEQEGAEIHEDQIGRMAGKLAFACRARTGATILVTNEVGMGIVPDNPLARRYRDLAGRCNQVLAAAAQRVVLLVSGIPMTIKGGSDSEGSRA